MPSSYFAISRWTAARFVIKRFIHHQFPWLSNSWYCFDVLVCRIPHSCLKLYLFFSKVRPRFMLRVLFLLYSMLLPWRHNHLILLIRRCFTRLSPLAEYSAVSFSDISSHWNHPQTDSRWCVDSTQSLEHLPNIIIKLRCLDRYQAPSYKRRWHPHADSILSEQLSVTCSSRRNMSTPRIWADGPQRWTGSSFRIGEKKSKWICHWWIWCLKEWSLWISFRWECSF